MINSSAAERRPQRNVVRKSLPGLEMAAFNMELPHQVEPHFGLDADQNSCGIEDGQKVENQADMWAPAAKNCCKWSLVKETGSP